MIFFELPQIRGIESGERPAEAAIPADIPPFFLIPQEVAYFDLSGFDVDQTGFVQECCLRRLRIFGQRDKLKADRSKGRETWA